MLNDKSSIDELYNLNISPGLPLETDLSLIRQIQQQEQFSKINQQAAFNRKSTTTPKISTIPVINKIPAKSTVTPISPTIPKIQTQPKTPPRSPKSQITIPVLRKSKPIVEEALGAEDPETGIVSIINTNLLPNFPNFNKVLEMKEGNGKVEFPTINTSRAVVSPQIKLSQQIEDKTKLGAKASRMEQELIDEVERRRQIHLKIDVAKLLDVRVGKKHLSYDKDELVSFLKELHKSSAGNKDVLIEKILADRKEVGL